MEYSFIPLLTLERKTPNSIATDWNLIETWAKL